MMTPVHRLESVSTGRRPALQSGGGGALGLSARSRRQPRYEGDAMCHHQPSCPVAAATDHAAARVVGRQDNLGWSLLCNGVVLFDDTGELLPDGTPIAPRRWAMPGDRRP